jgi:hypothetical protein
MWHILQRFILFMLTSVVIQTAAPPGSAAPLLPPDSLFLEVRAESNTLKVGQTQHLHTRLASTPGELVILTLSLTYPSGFKRSVIESTLTGEATLVWDIPPEAGVGTVTYELATSGCGCGYGQDGKPKTAFQSIVTGSFTIE